MENGVIVIDNNFQLENKNKRKKNINTKIYFYYLLKGFGVVTSGLCCITRLATIS